MMRLQICGRSANRRTLVVVLVAVLALFGVTMLLIIGTKSEGAVVDEKLKQCVDPPEIQQPHPIVPICNCTDPQQPEDRFDLEGWYTHHERMVTSASTQNHSLDLVILGDSIVERINGTGAVGKKFFPENRKVAEKYLTLGGGGKLDAIALGSGGDTTHNLLWHLMHGILPDSLQPKVWVIVIGTNNLGRTGCNQYNVFASILAVVKYLREQRPHAKIIIHGLLPRCESSINMTTGALWMRISWINQQLHDFCQQNRYNCTYMEAPDLFLSSDPNAINSTTMTDGLHPSAEGLALWLPLIVENVLKELEE